MDITLILLYSKPRIERCDFVRLNSIAFELTKLGTYIVGCFFFTNEALRTILCKSKVTHFSKKKYFTFVLIKS